MIDTFRRSLVDDGILVLTTRGIHISSNLAGRELSEFFEVGLGPNEEQLFRIIVDNN